MQRILLTVFFLFSVLPAFCAPKPAMVFRSYRNFLARQTLAQHHVLRKIHQVSLRRPSTQLSAKLKRSIGTIALPARDFSFVHDWKDPKATAFVIEETYKGKKYLWGVTASHYFFEDPTFTGFSSAQEAPIKFVAQGHPALNDVSLFQIPANMQEQFIPLPLAQHSAQSGETLYSAGYFDNDFHLEKNRTVTGKMPHKLITSLKVEDKLAREGACGSPVLNKQGEVVGMHVGSSEARQLGFVVPVEHIHELLQAFHNQGRASHPIYFNGRQLGEINVNETIKSISVWNGKKILDLYLSYYKDRVVDLEHLETLVNTSGADSVVVTIEKIPFSVLDADQKTHEYEITYNLKNFHVSSRKEE